MYKKEITPYQRIQDPAGAQQICGKAAKSQVCSHLVVYFTYGYGTYKSGICRSPLVPEHDYRPWPKKNVLSPSKSWWIGA